MADGRTIKTTLELGGEETYSKKLKLVSAQLRNVASAQKVLDAQYGKDDRSLAALASRQDNYRDKLDILRKKLELVKKEHESVAEAEGENSLNATRLASEYNKTSADIIQLEKIIEELGQEMENQAEASEEAAENIEEIHDAAQNSARSLDNLGSKASNSANDLAKIEDRAKKSKEALNEMSDAIQSASGKASKALFGAAAGVVGVSAKSYMDFEDEIATLSTIADESVMSLDEMSEAALEASDNTGIAAGEIVQAAYQALSAGVDMANAFQVTEKAAKTAVAGLSDTETVIDGVTSSVNAWKLGYEQAGDVMDKFIVAQNYGKTSVDKIASSIGNLTGLAPQLNISLNEILAATAAMTRSGYETSVSMTALRAVMSAVLKPTSEAAEAAKEMGLEFNAAALQSRGLTGFLQSVYEATDNDAEKLAKLFGSVEGLAGVMLLGGNAAEDYAEALRLIETSSGAMEEAYAKKTSSRAAQMQKSLNQLQNNAIRFGQTLTPYIDMASDALDRLNTHLEGMSDAEKQAALNTTLLTAGGLGAISMIGKAVKTVRTLALVLNNPIAVGIAGLAGLTAGVIALGEALTHTEDQAQETWDAIQGGADKEIAETMKATINAELDTSPAKTAIETAISDLETTLAGFGLTEDQIETIKGMIGDDYGAIYGKLLEFGIDETTAGQLAQKVTDVNGTINTELSGLNVAMDAKTLLKLILQANGNKMALIGSLKAMGLSDAQIEEVGAVFDSVAGSLSERVPSLYDTITDKLTDRKADTPEQTKSLLGDVQSVIDTAMAEVNAWLEEQKKLLDPEAADYQTRLTELETTAASYRAELESCETETVAFIEEMSGKSTETVKQHLGELEAIEARVGVVTQEIEAARKASQELGSAEYNIVRAGGSTDTNTIAQGVQWAYQTFKVDTKAAEDAAAQQRAELLKLFKSGQVSPEEHLAREAEIAAELDTSNERTKEIYRSRMADLLQGVYEAYETSGDVSLDEERLKSLIGAQKILNAATEQLGNENLSDSQKAELRAKVQGVIDSVFPGMQFDAEMLGRDLPDMVAIIDQEIAAQLETLGDDNPWLDTVNGIFESGAMEPFDIDTTNVEAAIGTAMGLIGDSAITGLSESMTAQESAVETALQTTVNDAADSVGGYNAAYKPGQDIGDGLVAGVNSKKASATYAGHMLGKAVTAGIRQELLIASPSKATYKLGAFTGDGFINAVRDKTPEARKAMRKMVSTDGIDGGQIHSGSAAAGNGGGMNNITVKYNGAYTRREAKRFGKAIGDVLTEQAMSRGG